MGNRRAGQLANLSPAFANLFVWLLILTAARCRCVDSCVARCACRKSAQSSICAPRPADGCKVRYWESLVAKDARKNSCCLERFGVGETFLFVVLLAHPFLSQWLANTRQCQVSLSVLICFQFNRFAAAWRCNMILQHLNGMKLFVVFAAQSRIHREHKSHSLLKSCQSRRAQATFARMESRCCSQ